MKLRQNTHPRAQISIRFRTFKHETKSSGIHRLALLAPNQAQTDAPIVWFREQSRPIGRAETSWRVRDFHMLEVVSCLRTDNGPTAASPAHLSLVRKTSLSQCKRGLVNDRTTDFWEENRIRIVACASSRLLAVFPATKNVSPDDSALSCDSHLLPYTTITHPTTWPLEIRRARRGQCPC